MNLRKLAFVTGSALVVNFAGQIDKFRIYNRAVTASGSRASVPV